MLIQRERSPVLLIDVQQRLLPAMHAPERVVEQCDWLLRLAARLQVPVLASEQYPRGLGHTEPRLREHLQDEVVLEKHCFSCARDPELVDRIEDLERSQWLLAGIESHVCVLQTALGLRELGKEVFVVAEAVASRQPADVELAFARMRQAGVQVVGREMVGFEWLGQAGTDEFREVSKAFLR